MQSSRSLVSDPRLPKPGDVVADKYRIEGLLGRGGMGAVLSATHRVTGRRVALKWLLHDSAHDAELAHRLVREAQAAGRVRHDNVVDVYDVGEHDGSLFLVMELLEGHTLSQLLRERGSLSVSETLHILLPVMRGVQAAHKSGVLHRDLKPSNIFLSHEDGGVTNRDRIRELTPRVLDFGVSKITKSLSDERSLTESGTVLGTPYYMAPEQLADQAIDARVDVYALGVILYQCLSGRLPFEASSFSALVLQVGTTEPVPLLEQRPDVPPQVSAIVMKAIARDPAARFESVTALSEALRAVERALVAPPNTTPPNATPPSANPQPTSSTAPQRSVFALALIVMLLVAAGWLISRPNPAAPEPAPIPTASTTLRPAPPAQSAPAPAVVPSVVPQLIENTPPLPAPITTQANPGTDAAPRATTNLRRARRTERDQAVTPTAPKPTESPTPEHPIEVSRDQF